MAQPLMYTRPNNQNKPKVGFTKGSLAKISSMKEQLPPVSSKTRIGSTESLSNVVKKGNTKIDENEVPIIVVLEGQADVTSEDGLSASGVETLIAGAASNVDEASHQVRYMKSFTNGNKTYLPAFAGVFYALVLTLTLADATSFDSQEIQLFTLNGSGENEEIFNVLIQPKTRNVKLLILSSREINGERVLFPSKSGDKTIEGVTTHYTAVIEGQNCTATCVVATPRDLNKLL